MTENGNFLVLQGEIERITYTSEETGFTVAKVKIPKRKEPITAVGQLHNPIPGEGIKMEGEWTKHPKFGNQFKIHSYESVTPTTIPGIERYLGSGLVDGIGPVMASRIVEQFKEKTLDIIQEDSNQLLKVEGIGKKRLEMIQGAWKEQSEIREIMLFLLSHGVGTGYATKIFKRYRQDSIAIVKENPYVLATDIKGIGFLTADRIAAKLGFAKDSPVRIEAGILYVLEELSTEGHVFYPYMGLKEKALEILQVGQEGILESFAKLAKEKRITIEDLNFDLEEFKENNKAVYLARLHYCETSVAAQLKSLMKAPRSIRPIQKEKALPWVEERLSVELATRQREAVEHSLTSKVLVITGGPGTGKTTIIHAILKIFSVLKVEIQLAAPTGRAAKRMSETTGFQACTIHRLLEYSFQKGGFQKNNKDPLTCQLLIIDEASMIDTILMHHLAQAIPKGAVLILVGDVKQLPSVGPGSVLNDIIASEVAPVVELNKIFRQAKESSIIVNSHRINEGLMPTLGRKRVDDFYFLEEESPEAALNLIVDLVKVRLPSRFGYDPINDIQVLSPMHKGAVGTTSLNERLQAALNPKGREISYGGSILREKDKVMQIRNDYDREVFNGDIGKVMSIDEDNKEVEVLFDGRLVTFNFQDLHEMALAYAISVHKSQGSEYPVVILPIMTQHYIMLQRNLIYTAVTRGKKLVVIVGQLGALEIGIKNDTIERRYSLLKERLQSGL